MDPQELCQVGENVFITVTAEDSEVKSKEILREYAAGVLNCVLFLLPSLWLGDLGGNRRRRDLDVVGGSGGV